MITIDDKLTPQDLLPALDKMWAASADRLDRIEGRWEAGAPSPVFTIEGKYQAQGWTEWTQGFQFGSLILQFDATGEEKYLEQGRERTLNAMAPHVTHFGVHDHGFNNVSTYGALLRLMDEGKIAEDAWERSYYGMALMASGSVQAARWSPTKEGGGYIHSFNGPQSLFVDTIRSCRALSMAHRLGHTMMGERDEPISLLRRIVQHAEATARYNIWYGKNKDTYDLRGRTAHESLFNTNNGDYRAPSTQQGYSPFSTWTRGLAWAMIGFPEQLEWLATLDDAELEPFGGRAAIEQTFLEAARATCDFYIEHTPVCGVPYWDTGAPGLAEMGDYLSKPADPLNDHEPVDSSAAAIGCQGLLRLAEVLDARKEAPEDAKRYRQAGLTVLKSLLAEPYLATDGEHEGLLLHTIYHRPNGWDHIPAGSKIPRGEACQWGDYHLREAALYVQRQAKGETYYTFFGPK
ncbi:Unsaturated glucuronyl hydrolase [Pseudobythopirellula maris]|uniref:Unsaturated glucuronyl hydrolase n=1 Tax=Pseudobythopirellula maris TaxID=2527991 RepID=A0A5C5ZK26_9BACT|nr:glycoside hydrolase family 88 protein [Pseudobythopirellula maris]TWT87397.1 Unsaturated glucuronyl hydrolase [Pseudobythopirellula maris]